LSGAVNELSFDKRKFMTLYKISSSTLKSADWVISIRKKIERNRPRSQHIGQKMHRLMGDLGELKKSTNECTVFLYLRYAVQVIDRG
jgi:hypothetical protein